MTFQLAATATLPQGSTDTVLLLPAGSKSLPAKAPELPEAARRYADEQLAADNKLFAVNLFTHRLYIVAATEKKTAELAAEELRKSGHALLALLKADKTKELHVLNLTADKQAAVAFAEGLYLSAYQFEGYKTDEKSKKAPELQRVVLVATDEKTVTSLQNLLEGVTLARDLVNMPQNKLTATEFSAQMAAAGEQAGFDTEILDFAHIESLRMGGLLAVNQGSPEPPTFTIMEWKPEGAVNKKPYVLVGKGVVYDTGGLSLKPTPAGMDTMKCDMAGAAAMTGVLYALAKNNVPLHVVALVPATDNRPGGNAFAPGDVITMHSGLTVEVLNTDAEGRLILADALSFARKYQPELVIDAATLTGSAARAVGKEGIVAMGTADEDVMRELAAAGRRTHERIVEFPLWDEYAEHIKSDIADINNLGKAEAGAISAGKFLERFADGYPWIHLDIAGPAYLTGPDSYRGKHGTGTAVRLLYSFLTSRA